MWRWNEHETSSDWMRKTDLHSRNTIDFDSRLRLSLVRKFKKEARKDWLMIDSIDWFDVMIHSFIHSFSFHKRTQPRKDHPPCMLRWEGLIHSIERVPVTVHSRPSINQISIPKPHWHRYMLFETLDDTILQLFPKSFTIIHYHFAFHNTILAIISIPISVSSRLTRDSSCPAVSISVPIARGVFVWLKYIRLIK